MTFIEKNDEIDRSALYSFHGPLHLLHSDVANLEFLGKSGIEPKYCLVIAYLFLSKIYFYPMKLRKSIPDKLETFNK